MQRVNPLCIYEISNVYDYTCKKSLKEYAANEPSE